MDDYVPEKDAMHRVPTENNPEQNTPQYNPSSRPQGRRRFVMVLSLVFAFFGVCAFSYGITHTTPSDVPRSTSLFRSLQHLVGAQDRTSLAAEDDRITVLLLGIGGVGHAGGQLTDTMILGSFQPSTGSMGMISLPRDLTLQVPERGYIKINAVHAYAEQDDPGSGLEATAAMVSTIFDEPIDYTLKVDFSRFADIIDAVGGVRVYVDRAFTDSAYPIDGMEDAECGTSLTEDADAIDDTVSTDDSASSSVSYACRYETLSFTEGWTTMNGATALKFARSRHGTNGEGSDFARAARQQKILLALEQKILSPSTLLNPSKLSSLLRTISSQLTTDMTFLDMMSMAQYADDAHMDAIASHVIDNASGLVYSSYLNSAYVLLPRKTDWSDFHALADNIFSSEVTLSASSQSATTSSSEKISSATASVAVENGTDVVGLASHTAQLLESSGYTVLSVGNAPETDWEQTTIIDFTDGVKDRELAALKYYLRAQVVMSATGALRVQEVAPDALWDIADIQKYAPELPTDFLIILGKNSIRSS